MLANVFAWCLCALLVMHVRAQIAASEVSVRL